MPMLTEETRCAPTDQAETAALRRSAAIRVAVALLLAGAGTAIAIVALWGPLRIKTDVIGYPIFADFNPGNYSRAYYLVVGLFPIAALLIFLALTRIGPRLGLARPPERGRLRPVSPQAEGPVFDAKPLPGEGAKGWTVAAPRVAFVGGVLGLEVGIASGHLWLSVLLVALGYGAATALASVALTRVRFVRGLHIKCLAAVNALGASLCLAGLVLVSAHTEVRILSTGSARHYAWFPVWLGLPLAALVLGWTLGSLRRAGPAGAAAVERRALLLIAAPVALLLLVAYLQGDVGQIDLFENGQPLAETRLIDAGWMPWRDVVLTHGLLFDVFPTWIGSAMFGNSYWGVVACTSLIFAPLTILATYFLLAYLLGRSWTMTLVGGLIFLGTWMGIADPRFLLWPAVLLALVALLKRPTRLRAFALALLTLAQAILTPEASAAVPAVTIVLPAYDWYWRPPGSPIRQAFRRSMWYLVAGIGLAAIFAIYMASRGALGDVVYVTINLIKGHTLDGGLPPNYGGEFSQPQFDFLALAPPAALLVSFAYLVVRLRLRRPFLTADWPMAANALFVLLTYSEFLARMDVHVYSPFVVALPLMLYIVYRAVAGLERPIGSRLTGRRSAWVPAQPIGLALVIVVVVFFWGPIHNVVNSAPAAYRPAVRTRPAFARVGYARQFDGAAFQDLQWIINAYLGSHDRLLDLTDEPALFYYFMDRDPSTRWYAPNGIVATAALQRNLLSEVRRDPPKLVVFDDTDQNMLGLPSMDGVPAMVRLYLISRWVLEHYRPLLESHGRTIYALRDVPPVSSLHLDLHQQPATSGVAFLGQECSWGDAPNFLGTPAEPPSGAQSVTARVSRPVQVLTLFGWAGDDRARRPAREVIATLNGRIVGRATPHIDRPDVPAAGYPAGFRFSGFQFSITVPPGQSRSLRLFAFGQDGSVTELTSLVPGGTRPAAGGGARIGGRTFPLQPGALLGYFARGSSGSLAQIELPAGSAWADYGWLEVDASRSGFRKGTFSVSDIPNFSDDGHAIDYNTMADSPSRYIVPVSSCAQWHGYSSRQLFLMSDPAQRIAGVTLIR